jgi:hypothetical protein
MIELKPNGNLWNRIFAPHGWWSRFSTNALKRPQWGRKGRVVGVPPPLLNIEKFRTPYNVYFTYSFFTFNKKETEKIIDRLAQEISDNREHD